MYKRFVPILLVIIWVGVIFSFSAQEGDISQSKSLSVVDFIYKYFTALVNNLDKDMLHYYVRKLAHVTLYLVLCLVVMNALYHGGFRGRALFVRALIICIFYASLDEGYQSFTGGRSGRITDVFIDSIGITIGIMIGYGVNKIKKLENRDNDPGPSSE